LDVLAYALLLAVGGLFVGALARLAIPGPDPMTIFQTLLVGAAGTLIAGLITYYAFDRDTSPGLLLSLLCAIILVFVIRKVRERQLGPEASRRPAFGGTASGVQVRFFPGCLVGSLIASVVLTLTLNLLIRAF
jgi:uncharacterized membrane protein YeaQ/YmgE (transglycosylase-associated protein family)